MRSDHSISGAVRTGLAPRLLRWFSSLSWAGRTYLSAALLVALVGLVYGEENWRGERAWENCRRELAAQGVELDWFKFVPPPVPDEQNFAMTPFLAPLFDFNRNPPQPGQTPWRDPAGHQQAVNFGAALLPMDKQGQLAPANLEGQMLDLAAALLLLRPQTGPSAGSDPQFVSRRAVATSVLEALKPYRPVLDELQAARHCPYCRFNIQYGFEDPLAILLPHYLVLQRVGRVLQVRASAELALDESAAAFEALQFMLFLADSIRAEPFLITLRARAYLLTMAEQILWEGLGRQLWSESQLRELQAHLNQLNLMPSLGRALQAERAGLGNRLFRYARTHKNALRGWVSSDDSAGSVAYLLAGPEGWLYQEQVELQRLFQIRVLNVFAPEAGYLQPGAIRGSRSALERDLAGPALWHHNAMSKLLLGQLLDIFEKTALAQARANLAVTACALERYRLAKGGFPATLAGLVPQFVDALPPDVCGGRPLKYRPIDRDRFLLYDVGWNETDEGGITVLNQAGTAPALDQGDWVWPLYPAG